MKTSGVYGWYNLESGKWYVGSSIDIWGRFKTHIHDLKAGTHTGPKFLRAWIKYGEKAWICVVLEECPPEREKLLEREQWWIDHFDAYVSGYNSLRKAGSHLGYKQSAETVAKRVATRRARNNYGHSEETKKRIGDIQRGKPKGPMSEKQKELLSAIRKQNPWSPERLIQLSEGMRNRIYTEEMRKNISKAHRGWVMTDSCKTKIGDGNRGKRKHDWQGGFCSRCGVELREDKSNYLFRC